MTRKPNRSVVDAGAPPLSPLVELEGDGDGGGEGDGEGESVVELSLLRGNGLDDMMAGPTTWKVYHITVEVGWGEHQNVGEAVKIQLKYKSR